MPRRMLSLMAIVGAGGAATIANAAPTEQVAFAPKVKPAPKPQPTPILPRVLPLGAPACGNVMFKSYNPRREDPICPTIRNLRELEQTGRKFQKEIEIHRVGAVALTLGSARRPRS